MQQQGGSQYGVPPPEMGPPFSSSSSIIGIPTGVEYLQQPPPVAEAASPINSRPAPHPALPRHQVSIFDDFGSAAGAMAPSFADEEALVAGEEADRSAGGGNRWPRQETLALLKIRSDMDAAFRDATLKGPLWEDVSRKLAELGYSRSAKKCKEKFENVHKYYKRTKEGRAGRQDGKSYRFFTQLEALHSNNGGAAAAAAAAPNTALIANPMASPTGSAPPQLRTTTSTLPERSATPTMQVGRIQPQSAAPPSSSAPAPPSRSILELSNPSAGAGISFSSNTSSSSASESDGEDTEEGGVGALNESGRRKRKRETWPGGSRKMMAFFDGLMKQVMERQEMMQQRFLETIEKREQDRMIREEAWKRQEMARLNREYELMAQERTMAANRDAAVISFLQKFTGSQANPAVQTAPISAETPPEETAAPRPPPPTSPPEKLKSPAVEGPTMQIETNVSNQLVERSDFVINPTTSSSEPAAAASEMGDGMCVGSMETISPSSSSSRWPKPEVLALIKMRSGLESRYLETGPKGPLWEEISLGMKKLGYSRNAKRCKEKWENINKYFKKVKESNKKRTEDAKTCPYFHELDALYRKKQIFGGAAANPGVSSQQQQELAITQRIGESLHSPPPITGLTEQETSRAQKNPILMRSSDGRNHESSGGVQIPRSNGAEAHRQLFFAGAPNRGSSTAMKKPEDIVRELMGQQNLQHRVTNDYDKLGGGETVDSDTINHDYDEDDEDNDDEDEDDNEEDGKLRFEIQFQRQGVGAASGGARSGNSTGKVTPAAAAATSAAASSAGSFLAMVQ